MKSKRRLFIDRKDARRCDDVTGMNQILIDLKPKRSLGELHIDQEFDVTNFVKYIDSRKKKGESITYFHGFCAAIGKLIYLRPLLNRFVANRHVYEHNEVSVSFVMKIDFNDKSEEIMVIVPIKENDNLTSISKYIGDKVNKVRNKKDTGVGANDAIQVLGKLPNILRVPVVGLFKFFDKKGLLPKFLVSDNLYYSSLVVSNLGTFKCDGIYHNVTDFGTCSGLLTIGEIKEVTEGKTKKYKCDFGVTIDERIGDGYYFIKSLKLLQYMFENPELLEKNINEAIKNEEIR